jgi:membrane-associated phospholipid phosphatase
VKKLILKVQNPRQAPTSRVGLSIERADVKLFEAVASHHNPPLDWLMPRLTRFADHGLLWLVCAGVLCKQGDKKAAVDGLLAVGLSSVGINLVVKSIVRRGRPSLEAVPSPRRLSKLPKSTSFPSGHSAAAAAFASAVYQNNPSAATVVAPLAAMVCLSRVYVGVHYPLDVAAGIISGHLAAVAATKIDLSKSWTQQS